MPKQTMNIPSRGAFHRYNNPCLVEDNQQDKNTNDNKTLFNKS